MDGHVHFHSLRRVAATLDAAARNFRVHGLGHGHEHGAGIRCVGALLLNQAHGERVFESLAAAGNCNGWRLSPVPDEPHSLIAERGDRWILIVCGRQVRCDNGLEVAALGTTQEFPDRRPFRETLSRVQDSAALTVLPWGFGKWLGSRGSQVQAVLEGPADAWLAVGDNGGRLGLLGQPAMVRTAGRAGFLVLPGTDPFPFGADHERVGAFGFFAGVVPGRQRPWAELSGWLRSQSRSPQPYGRALGPVRFIANQIGIQFYNRFRRRSVS